MLQLPEFKQKYDVNVDFLTYCSWQSSIKSYIRQTKAQIEDNKADTLPVALKTIYSVSKGTQEYYRVLTKDANSPTCCLKWTEKLATYISWKHVFLKIHKIQDAKLKWLQIRTVHRILATNVVLKEMGITTANQCTFCSEKRWHRTYFWGLCIFGTFLEYVSGVAKHKM